MEKPLFDDVGQELKMIAQAKARMIMIAYALLGVFILCIGFALADSLFPWLGAVGAIAAVFIFIYGYNKARFEVIMLYAYGELVHRVTSLEESIVDKHSVSKKTATRANKVTDRANQDSVPVTIKAKKLNNGTWSCPFCDHKNPAGADWCENCGCQVEVE